MHHGHSYKDFMMGLLIGGTIGASTIFVMGTKQGKKLQKDVLKKCNEIKRETEALVEPMMKKKAVHKRSSRKRGTKRRR